MTRSPRPLRAFAVATLVATAAAAIVGRHDRADADYLALAARAPAVARVSSDGAGVLVAPRWVLTAAHVAQEATVFSSVEIAGERIALIGRALHPSWRGDPAPGTHDLALLELARPAAAAPVALFAGADEVGRKVLFFGWGDAGSGDRGPERNDGRLRGAENRVETAGPAAVRFRFDAPPAGEPLEGVSGPGDSGGPALVVGDDGGWQVLGVSSGASGEPGRYGIEEIYARVSTAREWIAATMVAGVAAEGRFAPARPLGAAATLATTGGEAVARAFVEATAGGRPDALVAFDHAHRTAAALARRSDAERAAQYRELLATHGALVPLAVGANRDGRLPLLVRGTASGACLGFVFLLEGEPAKLEGYFSGPAACP